MEAHDESFHLALAEAVNLVLVRYLQDINRHIRVIRRLDFTNNQQIDRTYSEHFDICQHLIKRDLGAAQSAMKSHITARVSQYLTTDDGAGVAQYGLGDPECRRSVFYRARCSATRCGMGHHGSRRCNLYCIGRMVDGVVSRTGAYDGSIYL